MRKNLAVDIPIDAETEVQRIRGLKKNIFTETRIALMCLVLVVALTVTGTFANDYKIAEYTGNETPNRTSDGVIELKIVESINGGPEVVDQDIDNVPEGEQKKKVKIRTGTEVNRAPEIVHVSFVPQVYMNFAATVDPEDPPEASKTGESNVAFNETWSKILYDGDKPYIETDLVKLYLDADELKYWTYNNGTFTHKEALERGQETGYLLTGVVAGDLLNDATSGSSRADYGAIKVNVIAEAVQESAENVVTFWKTGKWPKDTTAADGGSGASAGTTSADEADDTTSDTTAAISASAVATTSGSASAAATTGGSSTTTGSGSAAGSSAQAPTSIAAAQ